MFVSGEDFEEWFEEGTLIELEHDVALDVDPELWLAFCRGSPTRTTGTASLD